MSKPIKKLADLAKEALDMSKEARMARAEKMGFDTAQTLYHSTPNKFEGDAFLPGTDSFIHFGTKEQAAQRFTNLTKDGARPDRGGTTIPVITNAKKLLELRDAGSFNSSFILNDLLEKKVIDWQTFKKINHTPGEAEAQRQIIEALRAKGYDGIKYKNLGEVDPKTLEQARRNTPEADTVGDRLRAVEALSKKLGDESIDSATREAIAKRVNSEYEDLNRIAKLQKQELEKAAPYSIALIDPSQIRSVNAKFDPKKKDSGNILDSLGPIAVGGLVAAGMSSEDAQAVILKVNPHAKDVKTVEELLKVAQEQRLLHHATTKKAIESIAEHGLQPGRGPIVEEAYGDTIDAVESWRNTGAEMPDDVAFLSPEPSGYFAKWQIEARSKSGKKAGLKEIQKQGGVGLFQRNEDIYHAHPDSPGGGEDAMIKSSVDPTKDASYPGVVPPWVEPRDYFTPETQHPDYIVTGKELVKYLEKADPHHSVYRYENLPTVQERFAETVPTKASKKKIAGVAGAATLAASSDALAADLNSPVASGMGEVASQAGHAMERFDAYTSNPFRKFLNSALEGKGIIQSAREGIQAFGAEKPTTGEEVAKNFLSLSPNQNLGFPTVDGGKDYPLAGPLGVAVDFAVDPTNIPMAKAVGPGMDAASSISRIIEQSLLKRGLVLP